MSPKLLNILLILTSLVLYFYVIKPLYTGADSGIWSPGEESIQALTIRKERYKNTSKIVDDLVKKANKLKEEYDAFDPETLHNMSIMVPDSVNNLKLLSEITTIANRTGLTLDGLGVKDKGGEYNISFNVMATYQEFKDFMAYYERSKRLLNLLSVNFTPLRDESAVMKFSVELTTYYLK